MPSTVVRFIPLAAAPLLGLLFSGGASAAIVRGALIDAPVVLATFTAAQIDVATATSGAQAITGKAKCDVKIISLNYATPGPKGEDSNSSGVLLLPAGTCAAPAALVAYAKGTDVQKPHTLADPADGQTQLLLAMFAAQGHAVVAPDYLGFAKSTLSYHPYLHADSEASTMIDAVRAARNASATLGGKLSGKVMFTGYSQGGHSSMAAHRAAERDNAAEINVIAGAHLAGPYNLSGPLQTTFVAGGIQFFFPYLVTAWQRVYGDVYSDVKTVFKAPYSDYIETLLPSPTLDYTTLITTGKLPGNPVPADALAALVQAAYLVDIRTNSSNPVFLTAKKNDLLSWNPVAQTLMCGGKEDPTVSPALNMDVALAGFKSRGLTNVSTVDVDPTIRAVYGAVLAASPATYYGNYHGSYEPPFCLAQARGLLDSVLAPSTRAADTDKVFAWAEKTYGTVFNPAGTSASQAGYRFRAYAGGNYLAVNETGAARLLYLGPLSNNLVLDLGDLATFVTLAK